MHAGVGSVELVGEAALEANPELGLHPRAQGAISRERRKHRLDAAVELAADEMKHADRVVTMRDVRDAAIDDRIARQRGSRGGVAMRRSSSIVRVEHALQRIM